MKLSLNKNCGIYKITSPTGRVYIGESYNLKRRFENYKSINTKGQNKLHNSLVKHGFEKHQFEIIEECEIGELKCRERFWQDFYDVLNGGLNCVLTKCGELKSVPSEETKKKQSEAQKGEKNHMFGKYKELNHFYGKKHSQETKLKISEKAKKRFSEKPNPLKGKKKNEETKKRASETMLNKYNNGYISPLLGRKLSQENKQKISSSRKESGIYSRGKNPKAKTVICLQTGIFYDCVKDAADAYNIKYGTLRGWLNPNSKDVNKSTLIYC